MALCFTIVIGISLASYITLSSRAMQLSNRSFQAGVSKQLAEVGIEEALRAFNQNNWDDWTGGGISADWTLDTTNKRATATMTFPAGKFGQGTTASVKIRVDNYDAARLGVSWSNSKSYTAGDIVGRNGIWYRCINANSNQAPNNISNLEYWVPEPIPFSWISTATYKQEDVVNHNGTWYRYINSSTSSGITPPNFSYWRSIPNIYGSYSGSKYYALNDVVYYSPLNTWIICTNAGWGGDAWSYASISWRWTSAKTYYFNDVVYQAGTWYRYISGTPTSGNSLSNSSFWENALSGSMHAWSSSLNYNLGDVVYHSGTSDWYRCTRANSGQTPSGSSAYWANTPLFSTEWDTDRQYSQNDTVRYNGVWYLSLTGTNNYGRTPPTAAPYYDSYWASTADTTRQWNASTNYAVGDYRCYGGVWYRCIKTGNAEKSPNDTEFWTAAWSNSWGITTGAPVVYAEGIVTLDDRGTVTTDDDIANRTQLRAPIAPAPLFPNAAGATGDLTITTGTGTVDSYDSGLGAYGGSNLTDSAVLAAGSALTISGTTHVKGYLAAPSLPANISTGTTVQEIGDPASPNLAPDRLSRSPHVPQFDILPLGGLTSAFANNNFPRGLLLPDNPGGTVNIGTPGATTPSRYYYNNTLKIGSSASYAMARLNINGPVILYVNGFLQVESGGIIEIMANGSAEIHTGGHARVLGSGILNRTQNPKKLILLTDSTLSADTYVANATNPDFYGVIYAPKITATIGLEIRTGVNLYGAVSAKEVTFSSEAELHYDTSLRHATFGGVDQPYAVTEWRELPATEQATMP